MPLNSHYSGRMENAIKRTHEASTGREGQFYSILNKYGYYDVNDPNNGLTKEQREQVPVINQTRMSQLSSAIADMLLYFLSDGEQGVITNDMQEIVDKLDIRASANSAQVNAIGNGISAISQGPLAPLQSINASRQMAEAQTTSAMGSSPFNADLIPPIAIGLDGLPVSIANTFKPGFFQPNWDFLYQQEPVKSTKFYFTGNGKTRLGANILLDQGNARRDLFIKNVFAVNAVDKNLAPTGDVKGGLTAEQYDIVRKAATMDESAIQADPKYSGFSINDAQIQASFFRYVQSTLWDVINNRQNWAHSHWGALTHNSCPEYVKTAVCSFLWTNGLSIDPSKSSEAGFISYCVTMGVYYLTGYSYSVHMYGISGLDQIIDSSGKATTLTATGAIVAPNGLPKSDTLANQYFTWVADILARLTYGSEVSEETGKILRKRRVAEANLIYKGLGKSIIEYGASTAKLDPFHSTSELRNRKFDILMGGTLLRYSNEGVAGGSGSNGSLATPEAGSVTIKFDSGVKSTQLTELSANVIKSLCGSAGVKEVIVTSLYRPPESQAQTMFNNLQKNNRVSYAPAGKKVVSVYDSYKEKYGLGSTTPFTDASQIEKVRGEMLSAIKSSPPEKISKHAADPNNVQAIDISPTRMVPNNKSPSLREVFLSAKEQGIIRAFLGPSPKGPGSDPAYHIEIWQNEKAPKGYENANFTNSAPPTIPFTMQNGNLKKSTTWLYPLLKDHNDLSNETQSKKS
jgi:hypothetical protein